MPSSSAAGPAAPGVAFLGLGTMGSAMAGRLLDGGRPLVVWNRTRGRTDPLASRGAGVAATPREAASGARVVLTMLADPAAVEAVYGGPDGVLAGIGRGALAVDFSTVDPDTARRIGEAVRGRGARFVDAPVYGSRRPAEEGALVVLAGGDAADLAELEPLLACLALRVFHAGPVGSGAALKLAVNLVGAHVLFGIATGLHLARKAGVDGGLFLDALDAGAFTSPVVELKGRNMLTGDFRPAFTLDLMRKDVALMRALAAEVGAHAPALAAIAETLDAGHADGLGGLDLSVLFRVLEARAAE